MMLAVLMQNKVICASAGSLLATGPGGVTNGE
jgi:hypothetical protein